MAYSATSAREMGQFLHAELSGPDRSVSGISPIAEPQDGVLAFLVSPDAALLRDWDGKESVIVAPSTAVVPSSCTHIHSDHPRRDYAALVRQFFAPAREVGISSSAVVHPETQIGRNVFVGHNVVIESGVTIGDDSFIGHNATILSNTKIGSRVSIGHNSVIGSVGFGLEVDASGDWVRIPHLGCVVIDDDVEIGASTVVARGTIKDTHLFENCKIDDNVFIAHNVQVGRNSVVIANAEVSGSVNIGEDCWIGPASTIIEQVKIGNGAMVGLGSVVIRNVDPGKLVVGNPAKVLRDR